MKRKVLSPNKGKVTLKTQSSKQVPKFQRVTTRSKTLKINKNLPLALTFNITYKYKDFQNADYNQYMEDFGLIIPEFMGDKKNIYSQYLMVMEEQQQQKFQWKISLKCLKNH